MFQRNILRYILIQLFTFTIASTRAVITTDITTETVFTTLARLRSWPRKTSAMSFLCAGAILALTIYHSGGSSKTTNRDESVCRASGQIAAKFM